MRLVFPLLIFAAVLAGGCGRAQMGSVAWQEFDGQRAMAHVEKLVALGPRPSGSEANQRARQYIADQLRALGLMVREQEWEQKTPRGAIRFKNLVADVRGENARVVVVGAHYDTKYFADGKFVGANDGASAAGVLLEMARVLSRYGRQAQGRPAATVRLAFFDGEEAVEQWSDVDGAYGSRHFVEELQMSKEIQAVGAAVVLDMIGDKDLSVTIPPESSPRLVRMVFDAATAAGVRERFSYAPHTISDDHTAFLMAGVPAVDVIDFEYGSQHGTNDYWHTPQDTLDKLSVESLRVAGQVGMRALDELVWRLAAGERIKL